MMSRTETTKKMTKKLAYRKISVRSDLRLEGADLPDTIYVEAPIGRDDLLTGKKRPKPLLTYLLRFWSTKKPKRKIIFTSNKSGLTKKEVRIEYNLFARNSNAFFQRLNRTVPKQLAYEYVDRIAREVSLEISAIGAENPPIDAEDRKRLREFEATLRHNRLLEREIKRLVSRGNIHQQAEKNLDAMKRTFDTTIGDLNDQLSTLKESHKDEKQEFERQIQELRKSSRNVALEYYQRSIVDFQMRLQNSKLSEDNWNAWIVSNHWILGSRYAHKRPISEMPLDNARLRIDLVIADDHGFIDIIEMKRPDVDVLHELRDGEGRGYGKAGVRMFSWSTVANDAIGQMVKYLSSVKERARDFEDNVEDHLGWQLIEPRGLVLIGREVDWEDDHRNAMRTLNQHLHGVEVITYDELLRRGENIVAMLKRAEDDAG